MSSPQHNDFVIFTTILDEHDMPHVVGMLLSRESYTLYDACNDDHICEFLDKSSDIDLAIFFPVESFEEFASLIEVCKTSKNTITIAGIGPFSKEELGISNWNSIVNFQN